MLRFKEAEGLDITTYCRMIVKADGILPTGFCGAAADFVADFEHRPDAVAQGVCTQHVAQTQQWYPDVRLTPRRKN